MLPANKFQSSSSSNRKSHKWIQPKPIKKTEWKHLICKLGTFAISQASNKKIQTESGNGLEAWDRETEEKEIWNN